MHTYQKIKQNGINNKKKKVNNKDICSWSADK